MKTSIFLRDVAGVSAPPRLQALLMYFAGSLDLVDPEHTRDVHPFVIPIGYDDDDHLYGFLRWPTPPNTMPLPIVRQHPAGLQLIAQSTDEMLHRELARRDASPDESPGALLTAANHQEPLYEEGNVAMSGLPLAAYFLLRVGVPPSFHNELIQGHLNRGDETAAMVTAEMACNNAPGWGRPHAMRTKLLLQLNKLEEARDAARAALLEPLWTLGVPFEPIARLAGWTDPITSAPYRELAEDPSKLPLDRAAHLMDAITVERGSWDETREALAALYVEAEKPVLARLIGRKQSENDPE
jgi:hypothetical protein